jgi:FtsP/CotA-like multicopper oxidase with cupredoxin domain
VGLHAHEPDRPVRCDGSTYTYLVNGHSPSENWTGLFRPGEKVRLRFINASAMSIFNIRIPGLPMTVVQADGQNVQPVETDEFQLGTAETLDVIVEPGGENAYTIMCETNDRSGFAAATLAVRDGLRAPVPALRKRPLLTMKDMGMSGMQMDEMAMNPVSRLHERPLGLEHETHRVMVYTDLKSLEPNPDQRLPGREIELHLTSNMERYIWSFDGVTFSEMTKPVVFHQDERLRLTLVNDTMMPHPIHLHGMFFEVVTGEQHHKPRKHTIVVKPGEKLSVDITADAPGNWAFHCHLLYHMKAGMMQVVSVREDRA